MAIAKDLPETYLCETDADRNRIDCYAGQKCIMVNGDIYVCITKGVWRKIGDELCAAIYTVEGETYLSQVYIKGESINAPDDPTIPDGTFNGWKVGEDLVEFPYTLNADTAFVADITVTPPTPVTPVSQFTINTNDGVITGDDTGGAETQYVIGNLSEALNLQEGLTYHINILMSGTTLLDKDIQVSTLSVKYDEDEKIYSCLGLDMKDSNNQEVGVIMDKTYATRKTGENTSPSILSTDNSNSAWKINCGFDEQIISFIVTATLVEE